MIGPGDSEARLDQPLQKAKEMAKRDTFVKPNERARVEPTVKFELVLLLVATNHGGNGINDQNSDEQDFAKCMPQLQPTGLFDGEDVDGFIGFKRPSSCETDESRRNLSDDNETPFI